MAKYVETTGPQAQKDLQQGYLRQMLENIARDLAPQYEGNVVIKRYAADETDWAPGAPPPQLCVVEQKPGKRLLGIFPRTETRKLFVVNEDVGRDIVACIVDSGVEAVVRKHLDQYVEEQGINSVIIQRGF